jgi:FkbM family methyltransferase
MSSTFSRLLSIRSTLTRYLAAVGLSGLFCATEAWAKGTTCEFEVRRRHDVRHPIALRLPTADLATFEQVFKKGEYRFKTKTPPRVIVDAGAHVGLTAIYFANRFPDARIIAIEPEAKNFELLTRNIAHYPNSVAMHAALWDREGELRVVDPGMGTWGFMTRGEAAQDTISAAFRHMISATTVAAVMRDHQLESIDILKIDIEGAEKEVFADSTAWLGRVRAIIIELHDRLKPGCSRSFYNGSNGFDHEQYRGESVFLWRGDFIELA